MMRTLIVGTAALIAAPALAQTEPERPPNIQVQGTATVETIPDRAQISYSVRGEGKTADDASRSLAATQKAIRDGLGVLLGKATEMTTGDVVLNEVRGPQCDANPYARQRMSEGDCAVVGYVATIAGMVRTAAIDQAGTAVGLAARLGARDARIQRFELADPSTARGRATAAAIRASTATRHSTSIMPKATGRISLHLSTSFGVVPEPMKAWKPEMAPQAMVIEMNGHTGPARTGPPPCMKSVRAGILISGLMMTTPTTRAAKTPILRKLDR